MATFFKGGSFEEQNSDPVLNFSRDNPGVDVQDPGVIRQYQAGKMSQEDALASLRGNPAMKPGGPVIDYGQGPIQLPSGPADLSDFSKVAGIPATDKATLTKPMTKEDLQKQLDAGYDPANAYTPEKSAASKISDTLNAPAAGTGIIYSSKPGVPIDTQNLPYNPGDKPTPPDPNMQSELYADHVSGLQSQVDNLDKQIADITAKEQEAVQAALSEQGVSTRYSSKEAAMERKGVSAQLAVLRAQRTELTRQISIANKAVSLIMSQTNKTYADASKEWSYEVSQNQKYINALDKTSSQEMKTDKAAMQASFKYLKDTPFTSLSKDKQDMITTLVDRVLGPEFQGVWAAMPDWKDVVYTGSYKSSDGMSHMQTLSLASDGSLSMSVITPATTSGPVTTRVKNDMINAALGKFQDDIKKYGTPGKPETQFINGADYMKMRSDYQSITGDTINFDSKLGYLLSPGDKLQYGIK